MVLVEHIFERSTNSSSHTIWGIGDLHLSSRAFRKEKFIEARDYILNHAEDRWVGMGDFGDCVNTKDPRFDPRQLRPGYLKALKKLPQAEAEELIEMLLPIAPQCLGLIYGNHEDALLRHYDFDLTWELCNKMGVRNLSDTTLMRLSFRQMRRNKRHRGRVLYLFAAHGYGNARKWGGKINKLSDIMSFVRADIYMIAHQHAEASFKEVELSLPQQGKLELISKPRIGVLVPSFYCSYQEGMDTYASRRLFPASALGIAGVRIDVNDTDYDLHFA